MLKSLLLFGIAVAPCAAAFAQSTFRWELGNTYAYTSYRYKSIRFQNIVVRVAEAPPVRFGVRQFTAFRIIVLNEDKKRRVELDSDRISCDCGRRKRLSAVPFRKVILPSRQMFEETLFSHGPATKGSCYSMEPVEPGTRAWLRFASAK